MLPSQEQFPCVSGQLEWIRFRHRIPHALHIFRDSFPVNLHPVLCRHPRCFEFTLPFAVSNSAILFWIIWIFGTKKEKVYESVIDFTWIRWSLKEEGGEVVISFHLITILVLSVPSTHNKQLHSPVEVSTANPQALTTEVLSSLYQLTPASHPPPVPSSPAPSLWPCT